MDPEDLNYKALAGLVHALSRDLESIETLRGPSIREIAVAPLIEDWRLVHRPVPALYGRVSGHPSIADGATVTSELFFMDTKAGYARTLSRWYRVGNRCPK